MNKLEKILVLHNDIEVNLLEAVLKEKKIPCLIKSNYDTAYDGLVQAQMGWGWLEAPPEYAKEIIRIYNDIIKNRDQYQIVPEEEPVIPVETDPGAGGKKPP